MPKICFAKKHRSEIQVQSGVNLMKALLAADVPVASSCHGDGVCGKCVLTVSEGEEFLTAPNEVEQFLAQKFSLKSKQRISCQVFIGENDLTIDATYW